MDFVLNIFCIKQCFFAIGFILCTNLLKLASATTVSDVTVTMVTGSTNDVTDVALSTVTIETPVTADNGVYSGCDTVDQTCSGRCEKMGNASKGECSCDAQCTAFNDCCPDFKTVCLRVTPFHKALDGNQKPDSHDVESYECIAVNPKSSINMKTSCNHRFTENEVIDLCVQQSGRLDTRIPVTDMASGKIYKNVYCAKCNYAAELQFWNMSLRCDVTEYQNISIFSLNMFDVNSQQNCEFEYTTVGMVKLDVRDCMKVISDCDNCERNQLCKTYGFEPVVDPSTDLVYQNKYCMKTSQVAPIIPCVRSEQTRIDGIIWYDINVESDGYDSVLLFVAIEGVSSHDDRMMVRCSIVEQCEFIKCPYRYDLVAGECVTDGALFLLNITSVAYMFGSSSSFSMDAYNARITDTLHQFLTVVGNMNVITKQSIWNFSPYKIEQNNVFHAYFSAFSSRNDIVQAFEAVTNTIYGIQLEMSVNKTSMKLRISYMFSYGVYGMSNVTETEVWKSESIRGLITLVCLLISSALLIIRIVLQFFIRVFHNHHGKVQCCLTASILAANVSFLLRGIYLITSVTWVCSTMAIMTHWLYLHMFTWMQVATYDIYTKFSKSFANLVIQKQELGYLGVLYAVTIPTVIVTASVIADFVLPQDSIFTPKYGTEICWISQQYALLIFFIAPMALILIGNTAMFFVTVQAIFRNGNNLLTPNIQQRKAHMIGVYLRPLTMVGLTWFIGLIANLIPVDPVWYTYIILNALQGAFLVMSALCSRRVVDSKSKSKRHMTAFFPSSTSQTSIFSSRI